MISPDTSRPGISVTPAGTGYLPWRWAISGRLRPKAATRISTSPGPGTGIGRRVRRNTSGPPGVVISTACMSMAKPPSGRLAARDDVAAQGKDERACGQGDKEPGDRAADKDRQVVGADQQRAPQVVFEHGPEDEADQEGRCG